MEFCLSYLFVTFVMLTVDQIRKTGPSDKTKMMTCATNKYDSDRELFLELFENPIHPLLIHIVPPYVNVKSCPIHK